MGILMITAIHVGSVTEQRENLFLSVLHPLVAVGELLEEGLKSELTFYFDNCKKSGNREIEKSRNRSCKISRKFDRTVVVDS